MSCNKKYGFSMLELVVVMMIMGTLAGIAISKMGSSDIGAIKASLKSDLRNTISGLNACYMDTLDFNLCIPNVNPVTYDTPSSDRMLGNSIYIGITTKGNSIKITTSRLEKNYFGISRLNTDINGYYSFNNSVSSSIKEFISGSTHPTLAP